MIDITMCCSKDCPRKSTCYRHEAKPNPYWQSYSDFYKSECNNKNGYREYVPIYDGACKNQQNKF